MTDTRTAALARHGRGPWDSILDVKAANNAKDGHWFDRDTMRFFGTKIETDMIAGRFFVTSEQPPRGPREFRVRRAEDDATIATLVGPLRRCPSDDQVIAWGAMDQAQLTADLAGERGRKLGTLDGRRADLFL